MRDRKPRVWSDTDIRPGTLDKPAREKALLELAKRLAVTAGS